jgi:hypothetical protein
VSASRSPTEQSRDAVQPLTRVIAAAFWFKSDLYGYARAAVAGEPLFLSGIDWTGPQLKRDSASLFVDRLVREQDRTSIKKYCSACSLTEQL